MTFSSHTFRFLVIKDLIFLSSFLVFLIAGHSVFISMLVLQIIKELPCAYIMYNPLLSRPPLS
jgi:hypothetical protein